MDYEKKYKEGLSRARQFSEHPLVENSSNIVEYIFPELKESKDDKIRKKLLSAFKDIMTYADEDELWYGLPYNDIIAWLEKQGESKFEQCIQESDKIVANEDGTHFNVSQVERVAKKEPKFHKGDWIAHNGADFVFQIVGVGTYGYTVLDKKGYTWTVTFVNEGNYHLWTIQDAKDGDVLACNEEILLFKSYSVQKRVSLYCWYNGQINNFSSKGVDNTLLTTRYKVLPATKEQRDLLFSKIKEAGYEWDAENKELKKISIITPLFNIGDTIIKKHNSDINDVGQFTITDITGGKYWYNDRIICNITEQDEWEIYEPIKENIAWSEEDETALGDALWCCKQAASIAKDENDMGTILYVENWLKSLKDRVQPYWKPSDEQMRALHDLNLTGNISYAGQGQKLIDLYNDLKKLREE